MKDLLIFLKLWDTNLASKDSKPKDSGVLSSGSISWTARLSQGNSNAKIFFEQSENIISLGNCSVTENLFQWTLKDLFFQCNSVPHPSTYHWSLHLQRVNRVDNGALKTWWILTFQFNLYCSVQKWKQGTKMSPNKDLNWIFLLLTNEYS